MGKDWTGNYKSTFAALGASNHTEHDRQTEDYYATDPKAIDKLLSVETPYPVIWECACGEGHLSSRLKQFGYTVHSSDLIDRGYSDGKEVNFLTASSLPENVVDCDILTNPPYKYAKEFVLKALELINSGRKIFMFLKLTFLEGKSRYNELFKNYPPKTVYVFSERIICAMNGEFQKYPSSAVAYAWFVWEKGFQGNTEIKWI